MPIRIAILVLNHYKASKSIEYLLTELSNVAAGKRQGQRVGSNIYIYAAQLLYMPGSIFKKPFFKLAYTSSLICVTGRRMQLVAMLSIEKKRS